MYLKLDALQPSGSFKDRGMATLCEDLKRQGAKRLISSSGPACTACTEQWVGSLWWVQSHRPLNAHLPTSNQPNHTGGNAGHSAALCGRVLGLPVRVIVPTTTKPLMLDKIRAQGAEVEVRGLIDRCIHPLVTY